MARLQVLVEYHLFNTRIGLALVYAAIQLPLSLYILEGFFARIPQGYFDAARIDGCSDDGILWRLTLPIGLPAIAITVVLLYGVRDGRVEVNWPISGRGRTG